ncbi:leucine-rich repeat domain-containing protein [Altibacter sp. HG106]|uniref:leucine-rich repeat domain-containing protein n=1 Tax=Altibacter sp. HG106 TaxID=3023937 RepID=UPI00235051BB|nr:hypothetical protein [Altibacter sp. HG106]MDC7995406.1 hypothetical protein [Altibacter sp. HG106]
MLRRLLTPALLLICSIIIAQVPASDKEALVDLYVATQGDQWVQSWDLNTPVEDWQGVTITDGRVTGIRMFFNNLDGTLPASIGNLDQLMVLELSFNKLHGSLPESLGKLSKLQILAFNGNELTGIVPESIANMTQLKQLHLSSNKLSGEIPAAIGTLPLLEVFNVFDNDFHGMIPAGLASNANLKELMVAENNFEQDSRFSAILMSKSGQLDLSDEPIAPMGRSIIAIETEEN